MDLEGVTIRRREDLERTGNWLLVRRSLGVDAFGVNLVEIPPGERIPEHTETARDQEEVFLVLEGSPSLVVDGREIETPNASTPSERIPEHTETARDQEEVFLVLEGSPSLVVDGREIETPAGTFARLDPHLSRTVVNHGDEPASVLIVSAPRSSGYEPLEWA